MGNFLVSKLFRSKANILGIASVIFTFFFWFFFHYFIFNLGEVVCGQ